VVTAAILCAVLILYVLLEYGWKYVLPVVALPAALAVITWPRLAVYQFVFFCFIDFTLVPSIPLSLIDISMLLVIAAAVVDVLTGDRVPERLPRLSLNYIYLIGVLVICGVLGYWPELAPRRVVSTTLLLFTFQSLYRLSGKMAVGDLLRWYFWLAVAHSVYVIVPYLAAGGAYRSFGFAVKFFDDFAMIALPLGVGLYLGSSRRTSSWYLLGIAIVFGGLVATQVRAAIVFAVVASLFVMGVAYRRTRRAGDPNEAGQGIRRRVRRLVWLPAVFIALAVLMRPELFTAVLERFGELFSAKPTGTTVYRLALWKRALVAFIDHPVFGVGPGGYYHLNTLYETLHLTPDSNYLRGLGAHSPFLHYLAETGVVGGLGILALIGNQFRLARRTWRIAGALDPTALALYGWAFLFAFTMVLEAGWMWGPASFPAVLMAALTVRYDAGAMEAEGVSGRETN